MSYDLTPQRVTPETAPSAAPVIEVRGLEKRFGDVPALDGISLSVAAGSIHGLLGPNGAGKTTLIRILTTLLRPDGGRALVAGLDVTCDPVGVRGHIGLAGQSAAVDDYLTGKENLDLVGRLYGLTGPERRRRASAVLDRIRLADVGDRLVKTYSGGMRRRLDLAASLVGLPQVLFLDEPTTGLDPRSRRDIWGLVRGLADEGTTVLLTTQHLEEADRLADRITVIDAGRVISEGTSEQLKAAVGAAMIELRVTAPEHPTALEALRELGARSTSEAHDRPSSSEASTDPASTGAASDAATPIWLPATEGVVTLREVLGRLAAVHITPDDITMRQPSLDEVFLTLTGHPSRSHVPGRAA